MQKEMLQAFTQIHKIKNNFFSPLPVIMRVALVKSMFVHMLIKSIALQICEDFTVSSSRCFICSHSAIYLFLSTT